MSFSLSLSQPHSNPSQDPFETALTHCCDPTTSPSTPYPYPFSPARTQFSSTSSNDESDAESDDEANKQQSSHNALGPEAQNCSVCDFIMHKLHSTRAVFDDMHEAISILKLSEVVERHSGECVHLAGRLREEYDDALPVMPMIMGQQECDIVKDGGIREGYAVGAVGEDMDGDIVGDLDDARELDKGVGEFFDYEAYEAGAFEGVSEFGGGVVDGGKE